MQPIRFLLIIFAVVNLGPLCGNTRLMEKIVQVSAQHHISNSQSSSSVDRRHDVDDPTAMVASMGDHHNSRAETNGNVAYSSDEHNDWQVNLDSRGAINLGWSLDWAKNEVLFTLKINTTGTKFRLGSDIFALGFSDFGQIESADFCLLWFDLAHSAQMRDAQTNSAGRLSVLDENESYCNLIKSSKSARGDDDDDDALLVFKISRPLNTCQRGYYAIDNGTTHLVWFKMDGPLMDMNRINLSELQQHQRDHQNQTESSAVFESGLTRVQLAATRLDHHSGDNLAHHSSLVSAASSSSSLDVRMENYEIPGRETTYWCKLFKLPHRFERRKFHITKYEAVISEGNEHIVHHMELFNCAHQNAKQARDLRNLYELEGGWSGECGAKDRPAASEACRRVIMAWAMGARPLEYPDQVGQAIGGSGYSPYVMLEVHYNNVDGRQGLQDSSGLRFHFTNRLRPFDAGIMEVGLEYTDKNSIPPNVIAPLAGYCVSECTRAAMGSAGSAEHDYSRPDHRHRQQQHQRRRRPRNDDLEDGGEEEEQWDDFTAGHLDQEEPSTNNGRRTGRPEGIYIFAAQMHTHLAGVASWTEQVREGRLLRELQRDDHYSPHFQEIRLLPEPVHLAPGDALIHYCLYDTTRRPNITLGGFATSDEMCVTYLHYYPRLELEVCKSSVDSRALDEYFSYLAVEENQLTGLYKKLSSRSASGVAVASIGEQLKERSVSEKYQSIEWSERRSRELLEFYANGPLSVQCNRSNGDRFPGFWNGVTPTRVYWPQRGQLKEAPGDRGGLSGAPLGLHQARDPPGRRLAGGYSHWGPQIMQYRGLGGHTQAADEQCSLASQHRRRAQLV